jgi:hypothetical protein
MKFVLLFVVIICAINALALVFFTVRAMRRKERWRVVYRDGFKSSWADRASSAHNLLIFSDAMYIENEFGRRIEPRRSVPGGFPVIK